MTTYIISGIIGLLIIAAGYFAWMSSGFTGIPKESVLPEVPALATYATSTFTIQYPSNFTVDDTYTYDQFPGKPIAGVRFTIPATLAEGTNLSSDSYLSVESLPRAIRCTGDIFVVPNVKATTLETASTTYSVATTSGAAAGNLYEEQVFAIEDSQPCTAVRYLLHSSNIGNFAPAEDGAPVPKEFDRASLLSKFDAIRDSLILSQ